MALISRRVLNGSIFNATGMLSIKHDDYKKRIVGYEKRYLSKCSTPPLFATRLAMPQDYDRIMEFMCGSYFKSEPSIVNIGLSGRVGPAMIHFMRESLREGMTLVATRTDSNCIIGAAVNVGSCPWDPERAIEYANCCECGPTRDLMKFYAYVTIQPKLWEKYCVLKIFECCHVAVDEEFQGLGVGKQLIQESWFLARDCGYRLFRIDCTSRYTAKIAEGFGWSCVYSLPYRRYIDCDDQVFKYVQSPHTEVQVFVDQVRFCKNYSLPYPKCKTTTKAPMIKNKK